MKPKSITTKLLAILISILLVIQPLSGCIADFSFDSLNSKNKNLSKEQQESLQKALTVSSLIDAKTVNLQTNTGVIIKGSQIQATTVNFMANFLNLISDKNSESYSSFSDSSGVVTRIIINQEYVKEGAVTGGWLVLPFINTNLVQTPKRLKVSLLVLRTLVSL